MQSFSELETSSSRTAVSQNKKLPASQDTFYLLH